MSATNKTTTTTPGKGAMESEKNLENDLSNIVEGAGQRQQMQEGSAAFLRSNNRHKAADVFFALASYTFSGLLHVHGQSTALTSLSLWAAGTTFLLNLQVRRVFDLQDEAKRRQVAAEMNLQERNVFQLEMVASWVWMLSSMQQFKLHRRMKYCGYSSWMGLGTCMYFTLRHAYNVLLLE